MSIKPKTIEENGKKNVIVLSGDKTLADAFKELQQRAYPANDSYLVAALPDGQYWAAHFSKELEPMRAEKGAESLAQLPIDISRQRFIARNTTVAGGNVVKWVKANPGSRVIIVDEYQNFVALFANEDMGGVLGTPIPIKSGGSAQPWPPPSSSSYGRG